MESQPTQVKMCVLTLPMAIGQFAIAIYLLGGRKAFLIHRPLIALMVVALVIIFVAPFTNANLSSGEKEDRGNRWIFIAIGAIALASAVIAPYSDRAGFLTIDGDTTRWIGVITYAFGGALRLYPMFVLGRRFSGLVAIQTNHELETHGIYASVRNPSYLGMIVNMIGWGLAFRGWSGVLIALLLLIPLTARIRSEERLLRKHFGPEYEAYFARTWRLVPHVY